MRWLMFLLGMGAGLALTTTPAAGEPPVAPMPREIHPDGSRAPVPVAENPSPTEDPAVVIERIIQNSKQVGEKLAQSDTGTQTRQTQSQILKDIDTLINRQEEPPPPQDNKTHPDSQQQPMNKDDNPNNQENKSNQSQDNKPNNNDMPMGGGMNNNSGMPMNSMNDTPPRPMGDARRPRRGDPNSTAKKDPTPGMESEPMKNPKTAQSPEKKEPTGSSTVTGGQPGGKTAPKSLLPFEEDVAKDVWGHLPDKLRQQMTQYYREDVTPKYSELLRLYYSSLSEKTTSPAPARK